MEAETSERMATALERLADSNQRIVEMADEERQANYQGGPAYCPHCGYMNPRVAAPGGEAPMADFVLVATCGNCTQVFFGVPEGWQVFRSREELEAAAA
jgi:hypothetical protein